MLLTLLIDGFPVETRCVPNRNLTIAGYYQGLITDMIEQNDELIICGSKKAEIIQFEELHFVCN